MATAAKWNGCQGPGTGLAVFLGWTRFWALMLGWVGLARSIHPRPEPMVTVQRLLRSNPLSGRMVPRPPNSAPGLSTWAAHSPRQAGTRLKTNERLCQSDLIPSEDGHPGDNCPPFRVSLQDCKLEKRMVDLNDSLTSPGLSALGLAFPVLKPKTLKSELSLADPEKLCQALAQTWYSRRSRPVPAGV